MSERPGVIGRLAIATVAALAVGVVSLSGSANSLGEQGGASAKDARSRIELVVERFNRAVETRNGRLMCRRVLPPSRVPLRRCARQLRRAMRRHPEDWQPLSAVGRVHVRGSRAWLKVRRASGPAFRVRFVDTTCGWRMEVFD